MSDYWETYSQAYPGSQGDPNCDHDPVMVGSGYQHGPYVEYRCKKCLARKISYAYETSSTLDD